jgi:hypothetical protein
LKALGYQVCHHGDFHDDQQQGQASEYYARWSAAKHTSNSQSTSDGSRENTKDGYCILSPGPIRREKRDHCDKKANAPFDIANR